MVALRIMPGVFAFMNFSEIRSFRCASYITLEYPAFSAAFLAKASVARGTFMSFDPGDAVYYPTALTDHRTDIDGPSLSWACPGVACPGDGARGVGVDGRVAEVGLLEPPARLPLPLHRRQSAADVAHRNRAHRNRAKAYLFIYLFNSAVHPQEICSLHSASNPSSTAL
jgi:hypothetical protein